ncbi:MAG: peptide chain release factor N(5)-glutamine methyltransferase [Bacteroidetes bacterium]|nr:peptide chain release factor N(5)-glutamine methyltransferase [Bacteroidota bacterium]
MQSTTIGQLRQQFKKHLSSVYTPREAGNMVDWLLQDRLRLKYVSDLVLQANELVDEHLQSQLNADMEKLASNMPIQHVLGYAHFLDLKLKVNEHVLIPRPETEELVSEISKLLDGSTGKNVLDIGTGSGCIPLGLAAENANHNYTGVDVSTKALSVAKENAKLNNLKVDFKYFDILNRDNWNELGEFDIIVSNPPYIPANDESSLEIHVAKREPHLALFSPTENPLLFYDVIGDFGMKHLSTNGYLFFELNAELGIETKTLIENKGYKAEIIKDLQENNRILKAQKHD